MTSVYPCTKHSNPLVWTSLCGFTLTLGMFSRAGESKRYFIPLPHASRVHSAAATPACVSPSLLLCPPMILSTVIIPSLLISDFLFSPFASFPPDFPAFSAKWDLAWTTSNYCSQGPSKRQTPHSNPRHSRKVWLKNYLQSVGRMYHTRDGVITRELLPPLGPQGWGKGNWNLTSRN